MISFLKRLFSREKEDDRSYHLFEMKHDFSMFPAGLTRDYGPHSAEHLRDRLVQELTGQPYPGGVPLPLMVFLDGTMGYDSAFLKEAFGGLVSKEGLTPAWLQANLRFVSNQDPSLITEIWEYIHEAEQLREMRAAEDILIGQIQKMNVEGLLEYVLRNPQYLTKPKHRRVRKAILDTASESGIGLDIE